MKKIIFYTCALAFFTAQLPAEQTKVGGVSAEAVQAAKNRQRLSWGIALGSVLIAAAGLTYLGMHTNSHAH